MGKNHALGKTKTKTETKTTDFVHIWPSLPSSTSPLKSWLETSPFMAPFVPTDMLSFLSVSLLLSSVLCQVIDWKKPRQGGVSLYSSRESPEQEWGTEGQVRIISVFPFNCQPQGKEHRIPRPRKPVSAFNYFFYSYLPSHSSKGILWKNWFHENKNYFKPLFLCFILAYSFLIASHYGLNLK